MDIGKDLAHSAGELTDSEISKMFKIVEEVRLRYSGRSNTPENLEALRDEVLNKLMDIGILATLDPTPCFYGEPPTLEIVGKVEADKVFHTEGFDHEKKQYEVRKATDRGEEWLGQKEAVDSRKQK